MSGFGFTEILLLAVITLIVVGPQRLPAIARTAGRLTRQARNAWQSLQSELQAELDADHNRKIMEADRARVHMPEANDLTSDAESDKQDGGEDSSENGSENGKRDTPSE